MSFSAIVLAAAGLALLFAPAEVQRAVARSQPAAPMVLQLWSAALLGLAAADWAGRGLTLGGIYGRALVAGNTVHWTVGALAAIRALLDGPRPPALWAAMLVYALLALGFNWILRRHPGPAASPAA